MPSKYELSQSAFWFQVLATFAPSAFWVIRFQLQVHFGNYFYNDFCFYFHRYQAIIHPLRPRLTVRVVLAIAVIWLVSIVLAFPNLIYGTTMPYGDRIICLLQWPDFSEYKPSVLDFGLVHLMFS